MTIPDGWAVKPLEDLCAPGKGSIVDGPFGSNLKRSDYKDSGIPVLKIQNIKENQIVLKKMDYDTKSKYQELERHSFTNGDIVMTKLGDPLGVSAIVSNLPDGLIVADLVRIRPSKVSTKFLCYQLNSPGIQKFINNQQKGTTRPRVNLSMIRNLPIVVPEIPEQERIVEILEDHLSRLDAALVDVKQAKLKAVSFRNSILHEVFSGFLSLEKWEEFEVKNLGKWVTGSTPKSSNPANQGNKVPFLTPGDVSPYGKIELIERSISEIGADSVRRVTPPSVNLVCIGATLGKVGWTDKEITSNQQINSLVVDIDRHNPEFIMWLFSNYEMQRILWGASSSTTVPILNKGKLEKLKVLLPSLAEQTRLLVIIQEQISGSERFLKTAEVVEVESSALRRSLLQAAFSGQLTKEEVNV
jgi:type I restriction enzyme S subunit